jgi:hypothetical protein
MSHSFSNSERHNVPKYQQESIDGATAEVFACQCQLDVCILSQEFNEPVAASKTTATTVEETLEEVVERITILLRLL